MFRFELRLADGDDVGTFETAEPGWKVGDTLIADGNRRYHVTAVLARQSGSRSSSTGWKTVCSRSSRSRPKFRHVWVGIWLCARVWGVARRRVRDYFSVTGAWSARSSARACSWVGWASLSKVTSEPGRRIVLRVRVASSASRVL
jgi:hypothetical protein